MFEENKNNIEQDLMFRSILEQGSEPVPEHIWDGIEQDLDRIARRRTAVLWFRRAAVGMAAAAVAVGLIIDRGNGNEFVEPASSQQMIAVVEQEDSKEQQVLVAMAETPAEADPANKETVRRTVGQISENHEKATGAEEKEKQKEKQAQDDRQETEVYVKTPETEDKQTERFPDVWPEDRQQKKNKPISFTLSGITGTNSAQNSNRINPMKRPALSASPKKTGVKETGSASSYGIPLSFGAGVRIGISPKLSIGTGLNYTLLTRKFQGTYNHVDENSVITSVGPTEIRNSQHYIGIPLNVYYDIISQKQIQFYAYAGGTVEKCITDKYNILSTDITHTEKVKGVQLSADLGIGVEFLLGQHLGIYIDPSLRYYFQCNQPKNIRTVQPLMLGFEMGLRVRL